MPLLVRRMIFSLGISHCYSWWQEGISVCTKNASYWICQGILQFKLFLEVGFKNHALLPWWWPTGPKISDHVMSLSQLNAVSNFFFYRKFFCNTFFHQNLGVFAISLLPSWCQVRACPPWPLCSQASRGLLDSTVCVFCYALERMSLRLEFQATVPFSCELTPSSSWGGQLDTGFSGYVAQTQPEKATNSLF